MSYRRCTTGFVVSDVCARSGNANTQRARTNGPKLLKRHFIGFPPKIFFRAIEQKGIAQACADGKPDFKSAFRTQREPKPKTTDPGAIYHYYGKKLQGCFPAVIGELVIRGTDFPPRIPWRPHRR